MIQAVIFDCFGLLYPDPIQAYRRDGKTPDHVISALHDIHERASVGQVGKQDYISRLSHLLNRPPDELEEQLFHGAKRNTEALEYVLSLRPSYKTAMLTNACEGMVEGLFSPAELQTYFDLVVQTCSIKTAKPDPAVFRWTCEMLALPPEQVVMVDDSRDNCAAARSIGMAAVRVWDLEQVKQELDSLLGASDSGASTDT